VVKIGVAPEHPVAIAGHVVAVERIPECDICGNASGRWDVKTRRGPWASLCDTCAVYHALYAYTGVGRGQLWIKQ
jgi:hypothetical protein